MMLVLMACMHSAVIYGGASRARARVPALSRQAFNLKGMAVFWTCFDEFLDVTHMLPHQTIRTIT